MFFQPSLSLELDPATKQYVLRSVTLVPSGHYSAGGAQEGALPGGIVLIPEARPVTLNINFNPGPATQAFKLLQHSLQLTGITNGHNTITGFTLLQGTVVGANSIGLPGKGLEAALLPHATSLTAHMFAQQPGVIPTAVPGPSWAAWINEMPLSPRSLHVMGVVSVPNPGVIASLKRAVPEGFNPQILILDLDFEQLPGIWPQVVVNKTVQHVEIPYGGSHTHAQIRRESGSAITVPIQVLS